MPPKTAKEKRTPIHVSLPPALATKLANEAEARMLGESLLVERAIAAYLPTLPALDNGAAPTP